MKVNLKIKQKKKHFVIGKIVRMQMAVLIILALSLSGSLKAHAASEYVEEGATIFTFSDDEVAVVPGDYTNYKVSGTDVAINGEGTYIFDGSCADGSITVKKGTTGVTLVLNGLTLTNTKTAPIACNKSTGVTIIAAEGTINTLTDNAYNNDDNYPDNEDAENAVIKCKDGSQVTIGGHGTLNINANGKNGIKSGATTESEGTAYLTIEDLKLNIDAVVNDALNAEATLNVESGIITISANEAEGDAIHSDYVLNIGAVDTTGPDINIKQCYEGLEAADLNVYSGNVTLKSSDDCMNAANSDLTDYNFSMDIMGGTLYMYTTSGDGIDSNGTLTISGGIVEVWSANTADNQPLDADGAISITGGTVLAAGGSSGMGLRLSNSQPYITYGSNNFMGGPGGNNKPGNSQNNGVSISAGSTVTIKDSSGNELYKATAPCASRYVVFSDGNLVSGSTYTLYSGNTSVGTATAQTVSSDEQGGNPGENPGGNPGFPPIPPNDDTNEDITTPGEGGSNEDITTPGGSGSNEDTTESGGSNSNQDTTESGGSSSSQDTTESGGSSSSQDTTESGGSSSNQDTTESGGSSSSQDTTESEGSSSNDDATASDESTSNANDFKDTVIKVTKKVTGTTANITVKKVTDAEKFEVKYSTNKSFKKGVTKKTFSKSSFKLAKLKKGTKYYAKIRAYKVIDGKKVYTSWKKISFTTKK